MEEIQQAINSNKMNKNSGDTLNRDKMSSLPSDLTPSVLQGTMDTQKPSSLSSNRPSSPEGDTHKDVDAMSASSGSSYRRRVPLTTLASDGTSIIDDDTTSVELPFDQATSPIDIPGNTENSSDYQAELYPKKPRVQGHTPDNTSHVHGLGNSGTSHLSSASMNTTGSRPKNLFQSSQHTGSLLGTSQGVMGSPIPKTLNLVLPEAQNSSPNSTTYYTYRAQLTFGLKPNKEGVNVAQLFQRWIFSSCESIPDFSLVPYEQPDNGQQITSIDQVPKENPTFYSMYYHNHRVLQHGNLTGMVAFQCSLPWSKLKSARSTFFSWLRLNNVYLNQTKFQTSTLVACGFLVGAHPGYTRRDHAEEELYLRLRMDAEDIPYQLTARTISVPLAEDNPGKFSFQAVVVETSAKHAATLRERFYSLDHPAKAQQQFPYTGKYQFVPILKSKEWTIQKILRLAKLHVKLISDLKPIFIVNLQDLRNEITPAGSTLMQGFYGMTFQQTINGKALDPVPLLHSIHNTGNKTTKVALVPSSHYTEALNQLSAIHSILTSNVSPDYHEKVFVHGTRAGLTGQQVDSVSSCNCSSYASELLDLYKPQDGEDEPTQPVKRFRPVPMSYAAIVNGDSDAAQPSTSTPSTSISSLTNEDINQLYERMKHHVDSNIGQSTTLSTAELEKQVTQSNLEINAVKQQLQQTVQNITEQVAQLSAEINKQNVIVTDQVTTLRDEINKQNIIVLGMQLEFQKHMADFSAQLQVIYTTQRQQTATPPASTSKNGQWGSNIK
jgi:hypothetical protein